MTARSTSLLYTSNSATETPGRRRRPAAGHYGAALETLITLNRFALYEQLHMHLPASTKREREANAALNALLRYKPHKTIDYEHPATGDKSEAASG